MNGPNSPINPQEYDPHDPRLVRVTHDDVREKFERITTNVATGGKGPLEPGWRCRKCAWTVPGINLPPPHVCQAINPMPPRNVAALGLSLGLLVEMLKTQGPVTFFVASGLPSDAQAVGATVSGDTLQLLIQSAEFPAAGIDEHNQMQLPLILPVVYFTQVPVVPVVELEEAEAVEAE